MTNQRTISLIIAFPSRIVCMHITESGTSLSLRSVSSVSFSRLSATFCVDPISPYLAIGRNPRPLVRLIPTLHRTENTHVPLYPSARAGELACKTHWPVLDTVLRRTRPKQTPKPISHYMQGCDRYARHLQSLIRVRDGALRGDFRRLAYTKGIHR